MRRLFLSIILFENSLIIGFKAFSDRFHELVFAHIHHSISYFCSSIPCKMKKDNFFNFNNIIPLS